MQTSACPAVKHLNQTFYDIFCGQFKKMRWSGRGKHVELGSASVVLTFRGDDFTGIGKGFAVVIPGRVKVARELSKAMTQAREQLDVRERKNS